MPGTEDALAARAAEEVRLRFGVERVDLALVLGSGWSAGADALGQVVDEHPMEDFAGFTKPVVAGHASLLRLVRTPAGKIAAVITGRTHLYEGRGVGPVVHGVRTMAAAGASTVLLTNGCGGLNPDWGPGTPVLIADHINLTGATPLVGPTFLDLTTTYTPRLRALARTVEPGLPEGVYVQFHGPAYETPAEVRMARTMGGDLVGMSTALEAIAARAAGLEVLGISLVTNLAAGISATPLSHREVIEAGEAAAPRLRALLSGLAPLL